MSHPANDTPEIVLRLAREAAASVWEGGEFDMPGVLEGRFDSSLAVRIAIRAIMHAHGPLVELAEAAQRKPQHKGLVARVLGR